MLDYNEITTGSFIVLDGEPYEVLAANISKKSRQQAANQAKVKNLISGKVTERSFHQSDAVAEADIEKKPVVYIFTKRGEYWFHEAGDKSARFSLSAETLGEQVKFLKEQMELEALQFNDAIIGLNFPPKVDLVVEEAPPAVKGNTAQGGTKQVTLETGATVTTPLFVETGDVVRVNTQTGEYVERVRKA